VRVGPGGKPGPAGRPPGGVEGVIRPLGRRFSAGPHGQPAARIESAGDGYLLRVSPALLDLAQFEQRLGEARAARHRHQDARAARLLHDGSGCGGARRWPGSPARTPSPAGSC
jgi:hypothetical protein